MMQDNNPEQTTHRRGFLGMLATGAAAIGLSSLAAPLAAAGQDKKSAKPAPSPAQKSEADLWFDKVKGHHRVVYDCIRPNGIFPFAWPLVFLLTNEATGSPASDCGVVVILRHDAIPYAFKDAMWSKYNFGEHFEASQVGPAFQAADAATATKTRNPFWQTKEGDFKVPGFGAIDISIPTLQSKGVMFCVCNAAMTVNANVLAGKMGTTAEAIMNEWKENLIPGIQVVPSGVWAAGRAQEHKCAYIYAG
jgi:intracellular sulfur oxidation DsrE/DsrF family protein